jgi:aryl sulfotransferase
MNNDELWEKQVLRNDDIIIASTIKSGTTWLQQIVAQIVFEGKFEGKLNETSYWIDTLRDYSEDEMISNIDKQTHRRFFKTHSPANVVLKNINNSTKYIFITRDFRDVVWSFYNHFVNAKYHLVNKQHSDVTKQLKSSKNPYEFWKIIMNNKQLFNIDSYDIIWSYFNTIKSWLNVANNPNVLILHFNELKRDLLVSIEKISKYLGYNYTKDILNNISTKCTFKYMKLNSDKCVPNQFKNTNTFFNKGTNKRWNDVLTETDLCEYTNLMNTNFTPNTINWIETGV